MSNRGTSPIVQHLILDRGNFNNAVSTAIGVLDLEHTDLDDEDYKLASNI